MSVTEGWSWRLRPHSGQVVAHLHADPAQVVGRAHATQKQQLGRPDCTRRSGSPRARPESTARARTSSWFARRPLDSLEFDAQDLRARHHLEVVPFERGAQKGVSGAPAPAVALVHLEHRHAVLLGAVVVVASRDTRRFARGDQAAVDIRAGGALVRHP